MLFFFILLPLYPQRSISVANLKYFETLSNVGVTSIVKRSSDGTKDVVKLVRFKAFDRDFDLNLKSGTHLMAKGFRARLINEDGSSSFFQIDQSKIFSGHLTDKRDATVYAHMEGTLWYIQIFNNQDIYAVEPAWRLLNQTENPKNDTMIAYRTSDFSSDSFNGSDFCGVHDHQDAGLTSPDDDMEAPISSDKTGMSLQDVNKDSDDSFDHEKGNNTREKRSEPGKVCVLFIVGDYTFYKGKCNGDHVACTALMFAFVNLANKIFKQSVFEDPEYENYQDIGLEIGEIAIYTTYTKPMAQFSRKHFNEKNDWTAGQKLDAFGYYAGYLTFQKSFCLHHLFSDYPFPDRVLGLAWMRSLCNDYFNVHSLRSKVNTGVSSGTDNIEGPISTLQMNLVFAHGHNFGSEHDTATDECSRPDNKGGNFLMWPKSVSGKLPNHLKFSPCSLKYIGRILRHSRCLTPRSQTAAFCGNGIVDEGQECDAGAFGLVDADACCTSNCKLRPHAICSDKNHPCCKNCTTAPAGTLCLSGEPTDCTEPSYCYGKSLFCPQPTLAADWTPCPGYGQCYSGKCLSYCEITSVKTGIDLRGCMCNTNENGQACKRCCFNASVPSKPGPCMVYSNKTILEGGRCYLGFCKAGVCVSDEVSTIRRLYKFLPNLKVSELGKFMKSIIVLCVIMFSLVLWLPPVYFIDQADKREQRKREKSRETMARNSSGSVNKNWLNEEVTIENLIPMEMSSKPIHTDDVVGNVEGVQKNTPLSHQEANKERNPSESVMSTYSSKKSDKDIGNPSDLVISTYSSGKADRQLSSSV